MMNLVTATVLAFERRLDISDAVFFQKDSQSTNKPTAVKLAQKSVRGTISNRIKNADKLDPTKLDAEIEKANLQTVDSASLDHDKDTLIVKWSCKVLPFNGKPNVCNNPAYQEALEQTVQGYLAEVGVEELARRYAYNIINARWLWRNRMGAENIVLQLELGNGGEKITFDNVKTLPLNNFDYQDENLKKLTAYMVKGLTGEVFCIINVQAEVKVGYGQEVFPSQELVLDNSQGRKSKILYEVNGYAGLHSQKVGNAIRTIDTWYSDNPQFPIAAEPYGAVTTLGTAFRQTKQKMDFYSLFDPWVLKGTKPALEQQHYVMSILIRGGVFGASGKE